MKLKSNLPIIITSVSFLGSISGIIQLIKNIIDGAGEVFPLKVPFWLALFLTIFIGSLLVQIITYHKKIKGISFGTLGITFSTEGGLLEKFHEVLAIANKDIYIVGLEKDIVFPTIISIFKARMNGINVTFIYHQEFHERYNLLAYLGCNIIHHDLGRQAIKFAGILIDPDEIFNSKAIVLTPRPKEGIFAKFYYGSQDQYMINSALSM